MYIICKALTNSKAFIYKCFKGAFSYFESSNQYFYFCESFFKKLLYSFDDI